MNLMSALTSTTSSSFYDEVINSYYEDRTLFINQDIDENIIEDCVVYILKWNKEDKGLSKENRKPIKIYLNSNGGDSIVAMQLVDVIKMSVTPITIIGLSLVASAAFHIFIAGHDRVCFDNTIFLMHDGAVNISNSTSKARDTMKFIEQLENKSKQHVLEKTAITEEFYDKHYDIELFMYANEAKTLGIVDNIIGVDCTLDYIF